MVSFYQTAFSRICVARLMRLIQAAAPVLKANRNRMVIVGPKRPWVPIWSNVMRLIFFSSERAEVELVHEQLTAAGIACEIHQGCGLLGDGAPADSESEAWIMNEEDSHRALMLCVQFGVGFAKRVQKTEQLAA